jgi:hypothetical protein
MDGLAYQVWRFSVKIENLNAPSLFLDECQVPAIVRESGEIVGTSILLNDDLMTLSFFLGHPLPEEVIRIRQIVNNEPVWPAIDHQNVVHHWVKQDFLGAMVSLVEELCPR